MNASRPYHRPGYRHRWGLRRMMVAATAVACSLLARICEEQTRRGVRFVRVMVFNRRDVDRHTDVAALVALAHMFANDVPNGKFNAAPSLTTADFRRRLDSARFATSPAASPFANGS